MNILKFSELNEAYTSIIGDKKAIEIVKNWMKDSGKPEKEFPSATEFINSPKSREGAFVDFIELYEELQKMREGKQVIYQESNQIREYIFSKVPDSGMMKVVDRYGNVKIEEFNKKFSR